MNHGHQKWKSTSKDGKPIFHDVEMVGRMNTGTPDLVAEAARLKDNPRTEAEARAQLGRPDPRDPDPSREGMWRNHNCSYCDDGRKPCKQGGAHRCSNPHARND